MSIYKYKDYELTLVKIENNYYYFSYVNGILKLPTHIAKKYLCKPY